MKKKNAEQTAGLDTIFVLWPDNKAMRMTGIVTEITSANRIRVVGVKRNKKRAKSGIIAKTFGPPELIVRFMPTERPVMSDP